jgi:pantetheine-phosphate adenylyltransferase
MNAKRLAIFPGMFDPVTLGHVDVIRRGAALFDEIIVAVGKNPLKTALLPMAERLVILRDVLADLPNVRVEEFEGLTVDYARRLGAAAILRGIRDSSDLRYELQIALTNRAVTGVETVFIMTSPELAFTSSTLIKQIASMGGDVSKLVPPAVLPYIQHDAASLTQHDSGITRINGVKDCAIRTARRILNPSIRVILLGLLRTRENSKTPHTSRKLLTPRRDCLSCVVCRDMMIRTLW